MYLAKEVCLFALFALISTVYLQLKALAILVKQLSLCQRCEHFAPHPVISSALTAPN